MLARLDSPHEILHQDPDIYQWDDWIPPHQIDDILANQVHCVSYTAGKTKHRDQHLVTDRRRCENHIITPQDAPSLVQLGQQAAEFMGVPEDHFEPAVLLKYQFDDYFRPHLDLNRQVWNGQVSNRVATILLYLNDDFQGGQTYFPLLGINTQPRRGRIVYWRYDYEDHIKNQQMQHSGEPVRSGTKYAVCLFLRDRAFVGDQRAQMSY